MADDQETTPPRAPVFRCAECEAVWRTETQRDLCCKGEGVVGRSRVRRALFWLWWPPFLLLSLWLLPLIHASSAWFKMLAEMLSGIPEATRNARRDHG